MACDHKGCHCNETVIEQNGKNFCSERCAEIDAGGIKVEASCDCGHSDCAAL